MAGTHAGRYRTSPSHVACSTSKVNGTRWDELTMRQVGTSTGAATPTESKATAPKRPARPADDRRSRVLAAARGHSTRARPYSMQIVHVTRAKSRWAETRDQPRTIAASATHPSCDRRIARRVSRSPAGKKAMTGATTSRCSHPRFHDDSIQAVPTEERAPPREPEFSSEPVGQHAARPEVQDRDELVGDDRLDRPRGA